MTQPETDTTEDRRELICEPSAASGQLQRGGYKPPAELVALLEKSLDELTYSELLRMCFLIWKEIQLYARSDGSPVLAAE
jgi:hypothetical protein